jgi:mono/diheme cytochrome c family protein
MPVTVLLEETKMTMRTKAFRAFVRSRGVLSARRNITRSERLPLILQGALRRGVSRNRVLVVLTAALACAAGQVRAQESGKTVADGVYTETQATRGSAVYDGACSGCHRADLGGGTGPALKDQRFAREFAGKDLKTLFAKVMTMPRGAPASLGDSVYLDVVAYLLKENGFPAGAQELTQDGLDAVRVLPGRPKPPPPVGDFSYVEVIGCLTPGPQNTWTLTQASDPAAAVPTDAAAAMRAASEKPLGSGTLRLLDAMAYAPAIHAGHKIYVRGLLIKLPGEQRMTISTLEMLSPTCGG